VKSNCVSIEPIETELGRKRKINQSSCNKDFSCVNGFCPSFVTVEGGRLRRPLKGVVNTGTVEIDLPPVQLPPIVGAFSILVTGIGGTGVVTIGQLLGMAAHLEGKGVTVLDMAGLAQKNGAVMSFVRIAHEQDGLHAPRIGIAAADAVLGCDVVVTAGKEALPRMLAGRTRVVVNVAATPTADFTRHPDWQFPLGPMERAIVEAVGDGAAHFIDATRLATGLLGDAITVNLFMLGFAWQKGLIPLTAESIERAIELNEVAIETNKAAFLWGRRAAVDPGQVARLAVPPETIPVSRKLSRSLDEMIARRVDFLADYQNEAWAERYRAFVDRVRAAEEGLLGRARRSDQPLGELALTEAVARNLAKLMSYKDEYEVARLYTSGEFTKRLAEQFEGDFTIHFHLAPPLLARRNEKGELVKRRFGPWMMTAFRVLARMKGLRGTRFDPFARTHERKTERAMIDAYQERVASLLERLDLRRLSTVTELASLPELIRGFGHVKERGVEQFRIRERELLDRLDSLQPEHLAQAGMDNLVERTVSRV
jgi:indolepyruvate ferredoxin oxidoreductase